MLVGCKLEKRGSRGFRQQACRFLISGRVFRIWGRDQQIIKQLLTDGLLSSDKPIDTWAN
jgi:hypothetical protein